MKHIVRAGDLEWEPKIFPGETTRSGEFKALWKAHGSSQFEMRLTRIGPGETNTKYHTHSREEEWFYVTMGSCHVCINGDWFLIERGDSVFKPVGDYHIFRNFGDAPCEVLMLGSNVEGSTAERRPEPEPPRLD
ncbi:MAG: cupin domain-containing protein [Puniceicoccaceae bacterium]